MKIASRGQLNSASHHADQLLQLAAIALLANDPLTAYGLADRYCRLGHRQSSHAHLLRAEALVRLQLPQLAHCALQAATQIDPENSLVLSRLLQSSKDDERSTAARVLTRDPDPSHVQPQTLNLLSREIKAVGSARRIGHRIEGWAAWRQTRGLNFVLRSSTGDDLEVALSGNPDGVSLPAGKTGVRLESDMQWARFALCAPETTPGQVWHGASEELGWLRLVSEPLVSLSHSNRSRNVEPLARRIGQVDRSQTVTAHQRVIIIIPVYRDVAATRQCLDCLSRLKSHGFQIDVVIVNDASPESDMGALLATYRYRVITNTTNLGYAGSVNKALAEIGDGDVVLLNADAYLGPTSIERLRRAAYSAPDIGTVTPLSNNGETTSLPVMFMANDLPDAPAVNSINATIAQALAGAVEDIPTGIGFCLFLRHDCRQAVGLLGEEYVRGYGEDADLCLRARAKHFRSVAALDVYVPHAGSRSFQDEKRSLVVRNIRLLDSRFPAHRSEVNAYRLADPVRAARLEVVLATSKAVRLVVTSGCLMAQAMECALSATSKYHATFVLQCDGTSHTLWLADERAPQRLATGSEVRGALSRFSKIEVALCDPMLTSSVRDLTGVRDWDLHIFGRATGGASAPGTERALWAEAVAGSRSVIATTSDARDFCTDHLAIEPDVHAPGRDVSVDAAQRSTGRTLCLAVIPLLPNIIEPGLITTLARSLSDDSSRDGRVRVVVLGSTPWDNVLQASDLVHVTGPLSRENLQDALLPFDFTCAWAIADRPQFGHPVEQAIRQCGVPLARSYWGRCSPTSTSLDLELDRTAPLSTQAAQVVGWTHKILAAGTGHRDAS